jgi:ribosomal protein S18 acetylase RimI-like enzyme
MPLESKSALSGERVSPLQRFASVISLDQGRTAMNEPFTVRPATIADYGPTCALLAEVDELHRLNLPWMFQKPAAEPRSLDFFQRLLDNDDSELLVADAGDRLVGVATALLRYSPDFALFVTQSWCVLDNIAVARAFRRQGIGSALIRAAELWAQRRGPIGSNWAFTSSTRLHARSIRRSAMRPCRRSSVSR